MTTAFVCGGAVAYRRRIMPCWGLCDGTRRRVVISYDWSPYYSPVAQCCACGDRWSDGELWGRPFAPGWRKTEISGARARWATAGTGPVKRDTEGYVMA